MPLAIIAVTHLVIDSIKRLVEREWDSARVKLICFCTDQLMHLAIIILCWQFLLSQKAPKTELFISLCSNTCFRPTLIYLAIFAVIWYPTSVLVKKVFCLFPSQETDQPINAGEWIGRLERVIVAALVLSGAVSSIAFVLTAKSVSRFKQFETQGFAERYLVGTLLSVAIALLTALLGSALLK